MSITIEVERVREVEKRLGDAADKAPKVIAVALNRTARKAVRILAKQAQSKYTIKTTGFVKDMHVKTANYSNLTATIESEGETHVLTHFKYSAPQSGAKAQVLKEGGLKALNKGGIKAFQGKNGLIWQRKGEARQPVKVLHSNSVPKMIESKKHVYGLKQDEIGSILEKNINQQIARILGGKG